MAPLKYELQKQGLHVDSELDLEVKYKDQIVGNFRADLVVENKVLLELKAQNELPKAAEAQIINYLKITSIKLGLLINFTYPKATVKRIVL